MTPRSLLWAVAFLAAATPALADQPLPPPAQYFFITESRVHVTGVLARDVVRIEPVSGIEDTWEIPGWRRNVHPSADGQYVLVGNPGLNLLEGEPTPERTVMEVWAAPGELLGTVPLGTLMDPADLEPAASHHRWIAGYQWTGTGWRFLTPDGQFWHLSPNPLRLIRE
ncbi:hypothetical protein [Rhodophyticola sp.]|jgi:hypothetical protein|uniref:hypothetical protein n=1 Tax=Rhodophyticola sp. TaxID=2680032 RepID=UPI001B201537|nr:hypothetical protein [Roseicyclus sp.]MBO6624568.1 hypothetical protein [Roseicyclus sp.]MBO6922027.1 hypothetical protein [Roseicyclus sp.]